MKLVDTSLWVEFLRRQGNRQIKEIVGSLLSEGLIAFTCPIRFELLSGVRSDEEADLKQALAFSHHVPFTTDDWSQAAVFERTLRSKGLKIPRNDLFVATVALRSALPLLCRDAHFAAINKALPQKFALEEV